MACRVLGTVVLWSLIAVLGLTACGGGATEDVSSEPVRRDRTTTTDEPDTTVPPDLIAAWEMDEPAGARTLEDSGPNHMTGTIGSQVLTGVEEQGAIGHRRSPVEPDASPVAPERLAQVPHNELLVPGNGDYAVTVRLRTTSPQGNVVQKGQYDSQGGYFKIDMDDGRVACLFLGSGGSSHVRSRQSIADGTWHEVRCVRSDDDLVLVVDGAEVARRDAVIGSIDNTVPVTIGGKLLCDQTRLFCDYFSGDIDRVLIERSRSLSTPPPLTPTTR